MDKHLDITVSGKVQGVFYRASAHHKANELGLKGFVENRPDGRVYLEAEGSVEDLERLIEWCKEGPMLAKVEGVEVNEGRLEGFKNFEVRR